jgi:hypothetical protein
VAERIDGWPSWSRPTSDTSSLTRRSEIRAARRASRDCYRALRGGTDSLPDPVDPPGAPAALAGRARIRSKGAELAEHAGGTAQDRLPRGTDCVCGWWNFPSRSPSAQRSALAGPRSGRGSGWGCRGVSPPPPAPGWPRVGTARRNRECGRQDRRAQAMRRRRI